MEKPSNKKNSLKPQKNQKQKVKQQDLSKSSLLIADSQDPEDFENLKLPDDKSLFLTKLALIFILYSTVWVLVALYIIYYPEESKRDYLQKRLHVTLYIYIFISMGLKMIFSFLGYLLRSFAKFVFLIDLYLSYNIILGLYFYMNNDLKMSMINYGNYVLIGCFVFLANSVGFFLATLLTDERKVFNYYFGIVLMTVSTIITLYAYQYNKPMLTMGVSRYYVIFIFTSVVNIYVCLNAFFVVNYRTHKFYKFEYIYCFMCFWADWFSNFWIDIVGGKKNADDVNSLEYSTEKDSIDEYEIEPKIESDIDIESKSK